ncbi:hypothetical protein PGQ11_002853 [Apiospora arundinis]|uniref:Uncharacterized protein n=1 Tax=Apiospora arundinis TaxID=335852 RepID=A0ABR2J3X6_9PEZI
MCFSCGHPPNLCLTRSLDHHAARRRRLDYTIGSCFANAQPDECDRLPGCDPRQLFLGDQELLPPGVEHTGTSQLRPVESRVVARISVP